MGGQLFPGLVLQSSWRNIRDNGSGEFVAEIDVRYRDSLQGLRVAALSGEVTFGDVVVAIKNFIKAEGVADVAVGSGSDLDLGDVS